MRYYDIVITDPADGTQVARYTSYLNGASLPAALNIELDLLLSVYNAPVGSSYARIWGITIQEVSFAQNFQGMDITISVGMQKGLPLANPSQAGVLMQGSIRQALGNWLGTDMTLDFFFLPDMGQPDAPKNIVINWRAGQPLSQAIDSMLAVAFPAYKRSISISPNLVLAHDEIGYYASLYEAAAWIKQISTDVINPAGTSPYQGVDISITQNTIIVADGTTPTKPKVISFLDLIGQPTWIESPLIQFKTVMRADLQVGDYISLPNTLVTTTPQSQLGTAVRNKLTFQGTFRIQVARHVGNYRQAGADNWVSIFDAYQETAS